MYILHFSIFHFFFIIIIFIDLFYNIHKFFVKISSSIRNIHFFWSLLFRPIFLPDSLLLGGTRVQGPLKYDFLCRSLYTLYIYMCTYIIFEGLLKYYFSWRSLYTLYIFIRVRILFSQVSSNIIFNEGLFIYYICVYIIFAGLLKYFF